MVAHQWDFCGGWHFLGPVSWHFKAAAGDWKTAEACVRQGSDELANLTILSGHPAFAMPLYDGLAGPDYPNPAFRYNVNSSGMLSFVEKYQRLIAFELPKRRHVAFARSIDVADYYRRRFRVTPRTVFVSRTEHLDYDMWWLCTWCNQRILVLRQRIPWENAHLLGASTTRNRLSLQGPAFLRVRGGGRSASPDAFRAGMSESHLVVRLHGPAAGPRRDARFRGSGRPT